MILQDNFSWAKTNCKKLLTLDTNARGLGHLFLFLIFDVCQNTSLFLEVLLTCYDKAFSFLGWYYNRLGLNKEIYRLNLISSIYW